MLVLRLTALEFLNQGSFNLGRVPLPFCNPADVCAVDAEAPGDPAIDCRREIQYSGLAF